MFWLRATKVATKDDEGLKRAREKLARASEEVATQMKKRDFLRDYLEGRAVDD